MTTTPDIFDEAKLSESACMSTSEQIAEALTILRGIKSTDAAFISALATIEAVVDPVVAFARHVCSRWSDDPPYPEKAATELIEMAAQYGLRITIEPGELVAYTEVRPRVDGPGWIPAIAGGWQPSDRDLALSSISAVDRRVAAVHLLPEGDKA